MEKEGKQDGSEVGQGTCLKPKAYQWEAKEREGMSF
jgi:hypothetical protein